MVILYKKDFFVENLSSSHHHVTRRDKVTQVSSYEAPSKAVVPGGIQNQHDNLQHMITYKPTYVQ
jgi:hypothetical protein